MQNQNQANKAMLSSKNLTILDDQMSKEALNYKKMNMYANSCNDQQLKTVCQKAAQMHKKHFDTLYNYLNSHNKPAQMQ
jgi:ferritin